MLREMNMMLFLTLIIRFKKEATGIINRLWTANVLYESPRAVMVTIEKTRAGG
jgi:hypothetical protein